MLAFKFASRTFAYRRLAQGLSRSLSAFSSFLRKYLKRVIKAYQCAQYVDDIGIAANDVDQLFRNLRATFDCIRETGLKLTMHKCNFVATKIDFLGDGLSPQRVPSPPHPKKLRIFWKHNLPEIQEGLATLSWSPKLLQKVYSEIIRNTCAIFRTP